MTLNNKKQYKYKYKYKWRKIAGVNTEQSRYQVVDRQQSVFKWGSGVLLTFNHPPVSHSKCILFRLSCIQSSQLPPSGGLLVRILYIIDIMFCIFICIFVCLLVRILYIIDITFLYIHRYYILYIYTPHTPGCPLETCAGPSCRRCPPWKWWFQACQG